MHVLFVFSSIMHVVEHLYNTMDPYSIEMLDTDRYSE